MAIPIWKDVYVNIGLTDPLYYRILLADTDEVIYSGKAHIRPGAAANEVRINDICADYLQNVLPYLGQAEFTELTLPVTFSVESSSDGSLWTNKGNFQFINDWSYDYGYDPDVDGMSFPINGRIDARMPIVWTGLNVPDVTATIYFKDGTTNQVIIPLEITADFNDDYNNDFAREARSAGSGTAVFFPNAWDNVDKIVVNNSTFKVVTECARYALYYVNAYGGWDCLLIEGNHLEEDTLKRYTREMVYDNREVSNRGVENYVNEITKGFTLHTGWLLHEQGEMMHHLLNSTDVYLYDIAKEQIIPVTIPTTTCEYKNYRNQGNQLVNYTIRVEVAQNRIRR